MEFGWNAEQDAIRAEVQRITARFDDTYWREQDREQIFPEAFYRAMADGGWLGVAMPEAHGGSGLGIVEAALILREVAASGACMSGASAIHMNIFGVNPLVVQGTPEQQAAWLPSIVQGHAKVAFGVTEPDVGLDTTRIRTRAVREGDHYRVSGHKVWVSTAQVASKILPPARTTPLEETDRPAEGLSLFFTDLDRSAIDAREIDKCGRAAVDSNELFIDDPRIPADHLIGEEGRGFPISWTG